MLLCYTLYNCIHVTDTLPWCRTVTVTSKQRPSRLPFGCRNHNAMHTNMKYLNNNAALIGQQYISWIQCTCNVMTIHFITFQDDICTMSQWQESSVTMIPLKDPTSPYNKMQWDPIISGLYTRTKCIHSRSATLHGTFHLAPLLEQLLTLPSIPSFP